MFLNRYIAWFVFFILPWNSNSTGLFSDTDLNIWKNLYDQASLMINSWGVTYGSPYVSAKLLSVHIYSLATTVQRVVSQTCLNRVSILSWFISNVAFFPPGLVVSDLTLDRSQVWSWSHSIPVCYSVFNICVADSNHRICQQLLLRLGIVQTMPWLQYRSLLSSVTLLYRQFLSSVTWVYPLHSSVPWGYRSLFSSLTMALASAF